MLFNISENAAGKMQVAIIKKQYMLERSFRKNIREILDYQHKIIANHAKSGFLNIETTIDSLRGYMLKAISQQYTKVGAVFFPWIQAEFLKNKTNKKAVDSGGNSGLLAAGAGGAAGGGGMAAEFWRAFHNWTLILATKKVNDINKTTKRLIREVIQNTVAEGGSYDIIAENIMQQAKTINKSRAMRIARTEVHAASVHAIDESVKSTRVKFEKIWTSKIDERTRIDHAIVNGQRRAQTDYFDVGGEKLMMPGDPRGSAGNIINCRCVVRYVNKELQRYFV